MRYGRHSHLLKASNKTETHEKLQIKLLYFAKLAMALEDFPFF